MMALCLESRMPLLNINSNMPSSIFLMVSVMAEKQVKDYEKFVVRFPDGMRDAIAERAKANGRSMNSEIVQILQDAIESGGKKSEIPTTATEFLAKQEQFFTEQLALIKQMASKSEK